MPPAYIADKNGKPMHSWRILILPYIDQVELYNAYRFDEPWDGPNNRKLAGRMPAHFKLSAIERPGNTTTNYLAVVGPETVWRPNEGMKWADVTDGSSNTILIVENVGANVHWMEPRDLNFADMDFTLKSKNGISSRYVDPAVAMMDCAIRRLLPDMSRQTLRALLTANGGEKLSLDPNTGEWQLLEDGRKRPLAEP